MVRLHVHGNSAVGETFDHVRLPQRPMPIEQRAVEHGGQLEQLADSTRLGQREQPDVILEIDVCVLRPTHRREVRQELHRLATEEGPNRVDVGERTVERPGEFAVVPFRRNEKRQATDVHGMLP